MAWNIIAAGAVRKGPAAARYAAPPSRHDLRRVRQLWEREVPLRIVEAAFLLASARRAARRPDAMPLGRIRSLHYFLPVLEELLAQPVPESYLAYLRTKLQTHLTPRAHSPRASLRSLSSRAR